MLAPFKENDLMETVTSTQRLFSFHELCSQDVFQLSFFPHRRQSTTKRV